MSGKKVVVIGSGVGGSGVAALLQNNGFDVTVLEKNPYYGGKCHSFEKNDFIVDSGVHMYSTGEAGPLQEINSRIGGDLKWLTQRHLITFRFADKFWLNYCQPAIDPVMIGQLGYIEMMTILNRGMQGKPVQAGDEARIKKTSNTLFKVLQRDGGLTGVLREMMKLVTFNEVFLSDIDRLTTYEFLSSFTDNLIFHQLIAYASQILTVTPYTESSAGEFFWCAIKQVMKYKVSIPKGGSRAIPAAYLKALVRDGGKVETGAKVKNILVSSGRVRGVETEDGREFEADIVISNAGIKLTVEMAGKKSFPADYVKRVDELKQSHSGITRKYGLSRKVVDVGSSGFFYVPDLDPVHMFDYVDNGEVPLEPCLFTPIPSELDDTLAPLGKQLVLMGMPGPKDGSSESSRKHCDAILQKGEEKMFECFPEMEKNIEWQMQTDTHFYSSITGKPTGECIGIAQCAGQTGADKPSVQTPVKGLYLVGCDAGARGVGTEQAAGSAIRVAQLIESEMPESERRKKNTKKRAPAKEKAKARA
ncbi:MAG: NAD(P)/FAD-dependent oxidoreductase [Actinobacteria bacterium]|nr:NAD(P)/FAD-dependent oxidoreductase [Actinomycetota bacterium]